MPDYASFGYTRLEAEQIVRTARLLWARYTAMGLTIDSTEALPTALEPFEVLVQAAWQSGVREFFKVSVIRR
jgi:hypothetical protein